MTTTTQNERDLLRAIYENDFMDGEQDTPGHRIWVDCIPGWSDEKKFPGTMASLSQKGLVHTDGETVCLTQTGLDIAKQ